MARGAQTVAAKTLSALALPITPAEAPLSARHIPQVGMICFLVTEAAFFSTLIVTYLIYLEQSRPEAQRLLSLPLVAVGSLCLFASSATVHKATGDLAAGRLRNFRLWWGLTIVLGILFLVGTAVEWTELIQVHRLSMAQSIFGSTYFTLVGFHAFHVTMGVCLLLGVLLLAGGETLSRRLHTGAELIAWYWHFVDGVWVAVFSVVYLLGR